MLCLSNKIGPFKVTHLGKTCESSVSNFILVFPGSGGFCLNFEHDEWDQSAACSLGVELLYSKFWQSLEESIDAHVMAITFDGNFHYDYANRKMVDVMVEFLSSLPSANVFLVGWSFGGAVVLELAAAAAKNIGPAFIRGVVVIAGQGHGTVCNKQKPFRPISCLESLTAPLLFIAGTEDETFEGRGGAVRIAASHYERAVRCEDKQLLIMEGADHDCYPCRDVIVAWIVARAAERAMGSGDDVVDGVLNVDKIT